MALFDFLKPLFGGSNSSPTTAKTPSNFGVGPVANGTLLPGQKAINTSTPYATGTGQYDQGITYNAGGDPINSQQPAASQSGAGTASLQAAAGTNALQPYQNDVISKIQAIQNAYNSLNGGIDSQVTDKANTLKSNYGQQLTDLNNAYNTASGEQAGVYGARGLGDSSYLGNAQQQAGQTYNENNQSILNNENSDLASLGQYAASTKAQDDAASQGYNTYLNNIGNYDQTGLQTLSSQLDSILPGINAQAAGIGTNQQFLSGLNQITPTQNQGASQLASQLQQVIGSGAPQFAQSAIAQGLIKQANLTDPNAQSYWTNYYNQLLGGGQTA